MKRILALVPLITAVVACSSDTPPTPEMHLAAVTVVPSGFVADVFTSGLTTPTAMAFAPDGRLFIADQGGTVRVVKNGALLPTPLLTVAVNTAGERGLDGIAVDPGFATNGFVYIYYTTAAAPIHNRLSRFTVAGDVAVSGSDVALLDLDDLGADIHNGSSIHFGADGKLFVGVGDNNVAANAQSLSTRLGKILRINSDGTIPSDNPFVAMTSGLNQAIYALGFRNPFTFAVQPGTGRVFVDDVGNTLWEEIDDLVAGSNYGWPMFEGASSAVGFRTPVYTYAHSSSPPFACAITGGVFYNPGITNFPSSFVGRYFYGDYCGGWINTLDPATGGVAPFLTGSNFIVDLDVGADGALYYLSRSERIVGRVTSSACAPTQPPQITMQPANVTASVGGSATFTAAAVGGLPLSYQWQRNGSNIVGATSTSYTLNGVMTGDNGATFRIVVSNAAGTAMSTSATLTAINNAVPSVSIDLPATGLLYSGGDMIGYAGSASDPEDGTLPASAFTWQVDFHHDTHLHPFMAATTGATSGSFTVPSLGEVSANVWYRIHLTVTDSVGATATTFRDVLPNVVTLSLATSPAGLQVALDGQPTATPINVQSVVGIARTIGSAPNGGFAWASWSDGGADSHTFSTPAAPASYTATYTPVATVNLKINFQLAGAPVPSGYDADTGLVFGARANGYSYGWSVDHTSYARDRNINADQRLDTIIHMHQSTHWDVGIPNGVYDVLVSVGDPAFASTYALRVEGTVYWQWVSIAANQFQAITHTVTVTDGKLTVDNWDNGLADMGVRINYIEITTH